MKSFELSSKANKNGKRHFKAILYRIYPDSCVDEVNQVGTMYNKNGITWIYEYCEKALESIKGMSLRCEFADEERTELLGHGETDIIDGLPIFENAVVIGTFTDGYIQEIEAEDGTILACIGEGEIDAQCYNNFVTKLDADIANGIYPSGSIEIMHTSDNQEIIYKYGYKDNGRIPAEFIHSGYALLGVTPADNNAKLIELNEEHKEDLKDMTDLEIKNLVAQTVEELSAHTSEINRCKEECEAKIAELNTQLETAINEKNEIQANSEKIQEALDKLQAEWDELNKKWDELWREKKELEKALAEAQAKERIGELNSAIADFTEEEKAYAKEEIKAFNAAPIESEINSVVNKIWEGIGKNAKENEKKMIAEQNSHTDVEDIFSEVSTTTTQKEDINIF